MNLTVPPRALELLGLLEARGHAAYIVGGCVRDSLMGRTPTDWDIATSARPEEVIDCFGAFRVLETGTRHGTVTVMADGTGYEITTFRVDGRYSDHRRPDSVSFTRDLWSDLARRDFTVNAMAWNPRTGLTDPFGGREDLAAKRIACVGDPAARFEEDALRILRAVRFASVLRFAVEGDTAAAMLECSPLLRHIAPERVRAELDRALLGPAAAEAFARHRAVVTQVIPELAPAAGFAQNNAHHHLDVWEHTLGTLEDAPESLPVRLALLLHDVAKPLCYSEDADGVGHFYGHAQKGAALARDILTRLRYDNATRLRVEHLIYYHDSGIFPNAKSMRRWLGRLGEAELRMLLEVKRCDIRAHASWCVTVGLEQLGELEQVLDRVVAEKLCFRVKDLAVNGRDLMAIGVPQGRDVGLLLDELLEQVIEEKLPNERETLLEYARGQAARK